MHLQLTMHVAQTHFSLTHFVTLNYISLKRVNNDQQTSSSYHTKWQSILMEIMYK